MMVSAQREKCEDPLPDDLVVLMTVYKNAKTRNLKKQILSLYAYWYPMDTLKKVHQPYGKLSTWEIKQARSHANLHGPGALPENTKQHRVCLDMGKVDHFVEFINIPYFYQDASYGSKILFLDNGERIEMPNVVRTEVKQGIEGSSWTPYSLEQQEDLLYDFDHAQSDILLWKAHILRSINQEEAKQDALKAADSESAILIVDWAMKFLQIKYREKQSNWFGKRGLSWHISTVITKNVSTGSVELKSYAHLFDSCQQENTLDAVKKEHPQITRVNLRSDEAGCYHNNFLMAAVRDAGQRVGITVNQYDFSEPQYGKDVCDRILCPMKSSIRRCCNEGHDVLYANDMRTSLSERPHRGTTACVCSIDETKKTLEVNKIDGFSEYNNFKFEVNGMRVWRAHGIGQGKLIPYKDTIATPQGPTGLVVETAFFPFRDTRIYNTKPICKTEQRSGLFPCSEPGVRVILMLVTTAKRVEFLIRCMTHSEENGQINS
ncbi:hypothetical protein QZH41_007936 [Actinostola sp. cb2023]|nr:hypothetical protein QZH41_007936 [Actinostola sp. cb2023]